MLHLPVFSAGQERRRKAGQAAEEGAERWRRLAMACWVEAVRLLKV